MGPILPASDGTEYIMADTAPKTFTLENAATVCVVVPVRNRPDLLRTCVRSLVEQNMEAGSYEILVCDDGSTVDLSAVIREFQPGPPAISVVRQNPKGPAAARNMGFRSRNAEIFVCVDSDEVCEPTFLSSLVSALREHHDWIAAEGTVLPAGEAGLLFDAPSSHGGTYPSGASAYRAQALRVAGGLDETFPFPACEDAELAGRLLRLGTYGYVPQAIVYHPTRRISFGTRWHTRKYWRYVMILAKRYGFLAFPGRSAGRLPRMRVALAATVTLPMGRLIEALAYLKADIRTCLVAAIHAVLEAGCGLCALPAILFGSVPERNNYIEPGVTSIAQSGPLSITPRGERTDAL